ncbi:putative phosphatidylinositol-phosphatidylcholine transfer protein [Diplodia seriata]|uniref:Putative phosphatidylinositol-phosphatidylcholine transfer protein n=1 Tax=Diplodia seriata TaxID=420778 RepID=A0A0G2EB21_9PEZI|nr:putative phosphatidylinositol-phosphatidylcholine transfer protein [Diplodia seriata]
MAEKTLKLNPKYDDYDFPTIPPDPLSGHPGNLTADQEKAVDDLRAALEKEGVTERLDTLTMLRFLRARKFNVDLSKQMFLDCEKWRKEFGGGVDTLVNTFEYTERAKVFEYYPQYYHKTDKDGRPLYIEQLGKVDLNALYKITSQERMLQNLVVEYEKVADPRLPACSRKSGHLLETCCTIMDLKGVGISKASSVYGYVQAASNVSQNYYPERLGKLYIINAPWGFSGIFSVIKRFLDPVTVNKIHVLGSGYEKELTAQVPKENLPKQFGGTCECQGGCELSDMGPWQDPAFTKPPKWLNKKDDAAIQNPESLSGSAGVPEGGAAPAAAPAAGADAPAADAAKEAAPAAQ